MTTYERQLIQEYFGGLPMSKRFDTIEKKFGWLVMALEPEILHCDGEMPAYVAELKLLELNTIWRALEKELGRKVTAEEAWGYA